MKYTIDKIATLIGARRYGKCEGTVSFLLTDSRSLCFPEETLFFAIRTQKGDGHRYIADLYRRGVRHYVVEELPADWQARYPDADFLKTVSSCEALQRLAERHRDEFDIPVVGITGSNGKTMVKEWLNQLLSPSLRITRSPRSYNSQIGVPLSVWLTDGETQLSIFEAGISMPGEMEALRDIIQPTVAVLTNVGAAHQENFSTLEEKCREKLRLFHNAGTLVYNGDDELISACVREMDEKGTPLYWSLKDKDAPFYIKSIDKKETATTVTYVFNTPSAQSPFADSVPTPIDPKPEAPASFRPLDSSTIDLAPLTPVENWYSLPFIDEASIQNSIVCAIVALHLGMRPDELDERMQQLEPVAMRLEVKEGQHDCTLINDSYNSDINSLDIALDFMNRRPDQQQGRHTLILSDIQQSGMAPEKLYQEVSDLAVKRGIEKFIGIGPVVSSQADRIQTEEKYFFPTVDAFTRSEVYRSLQHEVILLKGARAFGFDLLTDRLAMKVHETILEVNLQAVTDNLNYYRTFLRPETKMVCMIKADGYGTGAVEIAKTLQDQRVDYLAVAVADEGATLRHNGITSNIMVMNPEMSSFKTLFDYDLEPEVYSFRLLKALIKAAEKEGITGYPVHVKLDTGMHRLGFDPDKDMDRLIDRLHRQDAIVPRSVFSHFVGSDSDAFDAFSEEQFRRFIHGSDRLQAAFDHKIIRHIDNSAGIEHFPERQLDMCRLGIGLYGVNPRDNAILHNVCTLKTTILQLRHVPAGETVGYSRKGTLDRDSVIAAIPIGYADGLNRHLGNRRGYCLVDGKRAEYVGNICMDVAMIDVTGIDCREGDTVEIFGDNLPVTVLSDALDTIPYEVLTGISPRVKRVYFQD